MAEARIGDLVLCPRLGRREYEVVAMDARHYTLAGETGKVDFYKSHCHVPAALAFKNRDRRIERANKIGKNKR